MGQFVVHGAVHAQGGVTPFPVVFIDPGRNPGTGGCLGSEGLPAAHRAGKGAVRHDRQARTAVLRRHGDARQAGPGQRGPVGLARGDVSGLVPGNVLLALKKRFK